MFAKLFGTDDDQVLVKLDTNEETSNPEVRVYCQPKDLGVCSVALSWNDDTEESLAKADKAFAGMTEEKARGIVAKVITKLEG